VVSYRRLVVAHDARVRAGARATRERVQSLDRQLETGPFITHHMSAGPSARSMVGSIQSQLVVRSEDAPKTL
jgi:hypothetical protein